MHEHAYKPGKRQFPSPFRHKNNRGLVSPSGYSRDYFGKGNIPPPRHRKRCAIVAGGISQSGWSMYASSSPRVPQIFETSVFGRAFVPSPPCFVEAFTSSHRELTIASRFSLLRAADSKFLFHRVCTSDPPNTMHAPQPLKSGDGASSPCQTSWALPWVCWWQDGRGRKASRPRRT